MESFCEIRDALMNMKSQEKTKYKREFCIPPELQKVFEPSWRRKILEWMYSLVEFGGLPRETVAVAAYFIDVSVSKGLVTSKCSFQLVATTALHLSIKLYDSTLVRLESLVKLCRGLFTVEDVVKMEWRMMTSLEWYLHPPTPGCFLNRFILLFPSKAACSTRETIETSAQSIFQKAVCEEDFKNYLPSMIAFAAIMISIELIDDDALPIWQRQCFLMNMATCARMKSSSSELHGIIAELKGESGLNAKLIEAIGDCSRIPKVGKRDNRCGFDLQSGQSPTDPTGASLVQGQCR
jgi:hypothetical protein